LVHEDTFWSIFSSKKFRENSLPKIYLGKDRIRIRTFSKVGSGSGQKSSGSATLITRAGNGFNVKNYTALYKNKVKTKNRCNLVLIGTHTVFYSRKDVAKIYEDCCQLEETGRRILVLDYRQTDQSRLQRDKEKVSKFMAHPEVSHLRPNP
jgi:hypothetical protein